MSGELVAIGMAEKHIARRSGATFAASGAFKFEAVFIPAHAASIDCDSIRSDA